MSQRPKTARLLDKATILVAFVVVIVLTIRWLDRRFEISRSEAADTATATQVTQRVFNDSSGQLPTGRRLSRLELHDLGRVGLVIGDTAALVRIVSFGDYSCGWCAIWDSTLAQLLERYPQHVAVTFRPLLLDTLAQGVIDVHAAAYCARDQGAFLNYHRAAFANQRLVGERQGWLAIADSAGITDRERLERCVLSDKYQEVVRSSTREAHELGLQTTPSSIVGKRLVLGSASFEAVDTIIGERLSELRRQYR